MDTLNNNLKSEVFQSYAYLSRVKEQRFVVGANYKSAVLVYAESGAVPCLSVSGKGYLTTYHNGSARCILRSNRLKSKLLSRIRK